MGRGITYNPNSDIPDLSGKVFLITGGTNGIGRETLLALSKHGPDHLYFTGRNKNSATDVISTISSISKLVKVTFLQCDLGDRESIREAFKAFNTDRLDVYVAAAGLMAVPAAITKDGYEVQFGTNHMGHAAILKLVLPTMLNTASQRDADVRYIALTSTGYAGHPGGGISFESLHTKQDGLLGSSWVRYGQSKLANILYARELARRYPTILSVSVHPGVVKTDLVDKLSFLKRSFVYATNPAGLLTPEEGAYNTLWAATARRENLEQGEFYQPVGWASGGSRKFNDDGTLAAKLWDWTELEMSGFGNQNRAA